MQRRDAKQYDNIQQNYSIQGTDMATMGVDGSGVVTIRDCETRPADSSREEGSETRLLSTQRARRLRKHLPPPTLTRPPPSGSKQSPELSGSRPAPLESQRG
ncbi:hypothetical protein H920_15178 [Fukomys damarensis]|uniref:Uncharacterized protein n=1 Tax=Fukomys damarensis TaxID=885580 RepID=A0A091CYU5_FUKDA|nr:hypothetical protein H920_15178 [Fukomys damarensis]